jgi:hypothetical protein
MAHLLAGLAAMAALYLPCLGAIRAIDRFVFHDALLEALETEAMRREGDR